MDNCVNAFGKNYQHSCFSETLFSYPTYNPWPLELGPTPTCSERPPTQLISTDSWNFTLQQASSPDGSSPCNMLSFGNSSSPIHPQYYGTSDSVNPKEKVISRATRNLVSGNRISHGAFTNPINSPNAGPGNKRAISPSTSLPSYKRDHVIAERKRREKLTERFIALSAVVPGLKKVLL